MQLFHPAVAAVHPIIIVDIAVVLQYQDIGHPQIVVEQLQCQPAVMVQYLQVAVNVVVHHITLDTVVLEFINQVLAEHQGQRVLHLITGIVMTRQVVRT